MDSNFSHHDSQMPFRADSPIGRQRKYERLAAEAIERRQFWNMLRYELARDYNASIANVLAFARSLDVHFGNRPGGRGPH